ncbi:hypothetical protein H4217_005455 [Coemansia sp. RSA 1939]|nr:hypothetical protein H4217_005455 [Coemansia sp. RSA 1939]KAJ2614801.1 hypothetical protein EV177_001876 [Coemansia sp. RSA 1804]KAJ2693049.1 hypothetical protein GGH99_001357 [Coemansia sp. RSA 1285]
MKCLLQIASVLALGLGLAASARQPPQHAFVAPGPGVSESGLYAGERLIKINETAQPQRMGVDDIFALRRAGVRFVDITDAQELYQGHGGAAVAAGALPATLAFGDEVRKAIGQLSTKLYGDVLEPFTAFHNRYYDSQYGKQSSEWLQKQITQLVDAHAFVSGNVTVRAFGHKFPQASIIVRIEGRDSAHAKDTVVISAHQDSVNMWLPWYGRASGADDDGSGTVTILESLRALLAQGFAPSRSVEFHWYAGEEGGLLGSQDVALDYKRGSRSVTANLHFDMTGFWKKETTELIGLVSDRTDPEVRALVKSLAETYTRLKTKEFACGYGCSDHASWNQAGYRSAMAFESDQLDANTYIHSPSDTVETLDFDHMLEFSKLAVAFAYEVGYAK